MLISSWPFYVVCHFFVVVGRLMNLKFTIGKVASACIMYHIKCFSISIVVNRAKYGYRCPWFTSFAIVVFKFINVS